VPAAAPQGRCCARRGEADETPDKSKEPAMALKRAEEASRTNKKAEVIALLKRTKVVTTAES
jgi:hypothetical protein